MEKSNGSCLVYEICSTGHQSSYIRILGQDAASRKTPVQFVITCRLRALAFHDGVGAAAKIVEVPRVLQQAADHPWPLKVRSFFEFVYLVWLITVTSPAQFVILTGDGLTPYLEIFARLFDRVHFRIIFFRPPDTDRSGRTGWAQRLKLKLFKRLGRLPNMTLLVHGDRLKKAYEQEGVINILTIAEPALLSPAPEIELPKPEKDRSFYRLISWGHMSERKGIVEVLSALESIKTAVPSKKLEYIIAGKFQNQYYNKVIKAATDAESVNSNLSVKVYNYYVGEDFLRDKITKSDLVVAIYSGHSGPSGVLPIAAMFDKPVLVGDEGLMAEWVHHYRLGFVCKLNDLSSIGRVLIKAISMPRGRVPDKARAREFLEQNSVERFCRGLLCPSP